MPRVKDAKTGKVVHLPYTPSGKRKAKAMKTKAKRAKRGQKRGY